MLDFASQRALRWGPAAITQKGVSLRVLIIDDDPDDRLLIRELVEEDGTALCDTVRGFDEGLEAVRLGGYDAFLIDFRLGARSGLDLIAQTAETASGPMVLLTGVGNPEVDAAALTAGASDYLVKDGLNAETVRRSLRYSVETWRARRSAEEGYAKYRSLFDGVPVGLFRAGPGGTLQAVNPAAASILGYPSEQALVGRDLRDLFADPEQAAARLADALEKEGGKTDVRFRRQDGSTCWTALSLHAVRDAAGDLMQMEGAMVDITLRKEAEAEASFRGDLLDQVSSAVVVTDIEGTCTYWNRYAETMYGWPAREAIGRDIRELNVLHEDLALATEIMSEVERTGTWEGEFRVRRQDGSTFIAQVSNSLLRDPNGNPTGVVGVSMDITASKEAEAELREYQALLAAAFDASPMGKAIVSVSDGTIVSANSALGRFLRASAQEIVGRSYEDITHPDDVHADREQFQRLVAGEIDTYAVDKRFIRSDGTAAWGRLQASLIRDATGGVRFAIGQVADIDDRKRAEDQIRFQASLLDQVPNAVVATDLTGTITYWNHHAETMYGWDASQIVGRNIFDTSVPDSNPSALREVLTGLAPEGTWEGEVALNRSDGTTFPAWASYALICDPAGDPTGLVGVKVDLRDLKRAEALSRSLLESATFPIAVVGADGELVATNPAWGDRIDHGGPGNGRTYLPVLSDPTDEELIRRVTDGVDAVMAGRTRQFVHEYPYRQEHEESWFRVVVIPVADQGAVIVHWDITDERRAQSALEETIRAKDEFIASVSHELRTPLSVVVGLAETLRSQALPPAEIDEFHDLIADQAQEMALIVEDLLVAGRIDTETLTIRPERIDLAEAVSAVAAAVSPSGTHDIRLDLDPGLLAFSDPLRVRQILRNLLSNALRHGRPPVAVTGGLDGEVAVVTVTDHGDGVRPEHHQRMFEPYARFVEHEGQPASIGLGLHVSRRLARLMGGDLTYHRHQSLTSFRLRLPTEASPTS